MDAVSFLIDETTVRVNGSGMYINAIDSSHVAMLFARFPKEMFVEYQSTGEDIDIGISVADFLKILKRAKAADGIELSSGGAKGDKGGARDLIVRMISDRTKRTFTLKGKAPTHDDNVNIDTFSASLDPKFTASFSIESGMLDEIVKDAIIMSDLIDVFMSPEKGLKFSAEDDSGSGELEIDIDANGGEWESAVTGESAGKYSLAFLENIAKISSVAERFVISIGSNIPMKLRCDASADGSAGASITYFLAPRVDDDQDDDIDGESGSEELDELDEEAGQPAGEDEE